MIKPGYNKFFFLPDKASVDFEIAGKRLSPDDSYNPGEHQPVKGTVWGVPERLQYGKDDTLQWDTDMQLREGDEVVVGFYDVFMALDDDHYFYVDGERVFAVRYDSVIVAKRGDDIMPCNGYCLVSPLSPEDLSEYENIHRRKISHDEVLGRVEVLAEKNRAYFYDDGYSDDVDIEVGDVVIFDKNCDLRVENEGRESLLGRPMFHIQRRFVLGVIKN